MKNDHTFLEYEQVIINFTFSFSWDVINSSFDKIVKKASDDKEWEVLPLYKRPLWWVNETIQASYHPTIVSENIRVLHKKGIIDDNIKILAPINKIDNQHLEKITYKEVSSKLKYDIRIFENGTGTCTFSFYANKQNDQINFEKILLIHHLATSISQFSCDDTDESELLKQKHLTHSYLAVTESLKDKFNNIKYNRIYLAQLFSYLLDSIELLKEIIWDEKEILFPHHNYSNISEKHNWQNPYVTTIIQVAKSSLPLIFDKQGHLTTKEIGSICVRLTCDNSDNPLDYFRSLRREYIYKSLGFYMNPKDEDHEQKLWLRNYSHYDNLFYTYGRRAAIVITDSFDSHPAYYAIPTFVNIIEILRSRWHLGSITNLKLDETFEQISHREDINNLIDEIFKCRILYGLFLQNPTPYLFDSGAVTEISDSAENIFWLSKISTELEKKLNAIDRLVEVKFTKQSLRKFL